jgi:hypothetical protein
MKHIALLLAVLGVLTAQPARADELRPGYLELRQTDQNTYSLLFKIPARGEHLRLAVYANLPEGTLDIGAPRVSFGDGAYDASPAATDDHVKVACNTACVSAQSKPAS